MPEPNLEQKLEQEKPDKLKFLEGEMMSFSLAFAGVPAAFALERHARYLTCNANLFPTVSVGIVAALCLLSLCEDPNKKHAIRYCLYNAVALPMASLCQPETYGFLSNLLQKYF